jgi:hypothetical protein
LQPRAQPPVRLKYPNNNGEEAPVHFGQDRTRPALL